MVTLEQIKLDLKNAMLNKDATKTSTLRMILLEVSKKEKNNEEINLDAILNTIVKNRLNSIDMYKKANRDDLVQAEQVELDVVLTYLPKKLTEAEMDEIIENYKVDDVKLLGKAIGEIKQIYGSTVDMAYISKRLKK